MLLLGNIISLLVNIGVGEGTRGLFHPWARWMGGRTATNCCLSVCLSVVCLSVCLSVRLTV